MRTNKTTRSVVTGVVAGAMTLSAVSAGGTLARLTSASGAFDDSNCCFHDTFENSTDNWEGRGGASVVSGGTAYAGSSALSVTGRGSAWHGAQKELDTQIFRGGECYSFSVAVSGQGNMMLSLQYTDTSGERKYAHISDGISNGVYIKLETSDYELPQGSDYILYVETESGTDSFCIDEVVAAKAGAVSDVPAAELIRGDLNGDNTVDVFDIIAARRALLSYTSGYAAGISIELADVDGDGSFAVNDLVVLTRFLLAEITEFPKPAVTTTTTTTSPVITTTTGDYMAIVRSSITVDVPSSALAKADCGVEHITYFSKKANRNKGANVWLPPGYDENKKYPVFYVNHGYGGDEFTMVNGMGVCEIASNLIRSGEAEPMIIVFTNQYTDPQHEKQTGNGQADVPGYDNFVEDLPDSLMPYIESHYPVKTGRENTAIAGFSMGGRESLYIGMKCCDKIGYIGAGAPAPGIFPTQDQFMTHPGVMSKDEIRIDPPYSPYVLMIAGGTSDSMVNDFPKQYSDLFTQHGTDNIYISVPRGGHDSSTVIPLMYNFIRCIFKAV